MYEASSAFHQAVQNGSEQMPLLLFQDAVFTSPDINVDKGITFNDYFNMEDDLAIGQALANELEFSLFNDTGWLNTYTFGEFEALLGVKIEEVSIQNMASGTIGCRIDINGNRYETKSSAPFVYKNGSAMPTGWMTVYPHTIIDIDGVVYFFSDSTPNNYFTYDETTMSVSGQGTTPAILNAKVMGDFRGKGIKYDRTTHILEVWGETTKKTYEFVPLGKFIADRPDVPEVNEIEFLCNDRMMKFEKDMPSDSELGITYPVTIGDLFTAMCEYLDVPYVTGSFINSVATVSKRPEEFDTATMRDVLKWIAEAAGGNAKFDRDGNLGIEWIRQTQQSYGPDMYMKFLPHWYETATVAKLENRASDGSYDKVSGYGDETYLIQDNPLLRGVE